MSDLREKEMHRAQGTSHTVEGGHSDNDEEDDDVRVVDPEDHIRQRIWQQEHEDDEDGEAML